MRGEITKLVLIALITGFGGLRGLAASLEGFSSPILEQKRQRIISKNSNIRVNLPKVIQQEKVLEIKDGVLWHAPAKEFLRRNFSNDEIQLLDKQAMEILISGFNATNPDLMQANHKQAISKLSNLIFGIKDDSDIYFKRFIAEIQKEYINFKNLFKPSVYRDLKGIDSGLIAKQKLIYLCGNQAVEEVEAMWRRS